MSIYQMSFLNKEELAAELKKIGADSRCLPFFDNKREIKSLFLSNVDVRAANIIKQEMLSLGGDAAVTRGSIDCSEDYTDVILFGTKKQLAFFINKIATMSWWSLPDIAEAVRKGIFSLENKPQELKLPNSSPISLDKKTAIMGIINLTEDSFFAGSKIALDSKTIKKRALDMVEAGADILDIGAESTRPGASRIAPQKELEAITFAVREIRSVLPQTAISIDTTRKEVAVSALKAGADIINDISGLSFEPEIAKAVAEHNALLVIMHMKGTAATMGSMCNYENLLLEISQFFEEKIALAKSYGLKREKIILDPGFGLPKNFEQNLFILRNLAAFDTFGMPLLIGASRKTSIGIATNSEKPEDRLEGTLAVTALCSWHDVDIVRVHDIAENKKVVMMVEAIKRIQHD